MRLDALAFEVQFLDHLAPIWRALRDEDRGRFLVDPTLLLRARTLGIDAVSTPRPPHVVAYPPPRLDGPPALVASYGDTKEARRLGYGPFVFVEHGIGQSYGDLRRNGSYSGGADRDDTTLFLTPGPDPASKWRAVHPEARVEEIGSPRLDDLPAKDPAEPLTVAISFHWPAPLSISGYAGTALGDFLPQLSALAAAYTTIGHSHPKSDWPKQMRRTYDRAGIPYVDSFDEVCRRADVYVCDNSSTLYEFAATGRPTVVMNARWWTRGPELGLRFWAASRVGVNVSPTDSLIEAVGRALELRPEDVEAREAALDLAYTYRTGAAERAGGVIAEWLQTLDAAAEGRRIPDSLVG